MRMHNKAEKTIIPSIRAEYQAEFVRELNDETVGLFMQYIF